MANKKSLLKGREAMVVGIIIAMVALSNCSSVEKVKRFMEERTENTTVQRISTIYVKFGFHFVFLIIPSPSSSYPKCRRDAPAK